MTSDIIDLRSDTVTRPTDAMRRAMAEADVGDDVYGEDPTINALQEHVAGIFGREAALFVPSGTMGNEIAVKVLTSPGDEIIVDEASHILLHEVAAPATIAQVLVRTLASDRGRFDPDALAAAIRPATPLFSHTTLVCMENTHQASSGAVVPLESIRSSAKVARDRGCAVFLDGARIFNASVASGVPVADYAAEVDALSFCFSKGLAAPVGSMLVGDAEFIGRARKVRRMLGGAMRQVGVLAAAARVAIDTMVDRLADDHANAARLADGIAAALPGSVDPAAIETNIVYVDTMDRDAAGIARALEGLGVRVNAMGPRALRFVTHYEIDSASIDRAVDAFGKALAEGG